MGFDEELQAWAAQRSRDAQQKREDQERAARFVDQFHDEMEEFTVGACQALRRLKVPTVPIYEMKSISNRRGKCLRRTLTRKIRARGWLFSGSYWASESSARFEGVLLDDGVTLLSENQQLNTPIMGSAVKRKFIGWEIAKGSYRLPVPPSYEMPQEGRGSMTNTEITMLAIKRGLFELVERHQK
ncbi:hypothetical protein FNQ90_00880 [Streptomyces alkaliphilus]|uniref:Uncharacterized protein n=1 Tax=Streptomyces alkaliphilus TaxID=1472722 RepID=A0A7W3XZV9_9ACTN|nr:hypothetical protein [Streptomyces alkaliphilus]